MSTVTRDPVQQPATPDTFPFGVEFQKVLLKLLTVDVGFAHAAIPYLKAEFFENEVCGWAYSYIVRYQDKYNAVPALKIIQDETRKLDITVRELYALTLEAIAGVEIIAEDWLKDQTLDFIQRNMFVAAFKESKSHYNQGNIDEAYTSMREAMDSIHKTAWEPPDRSWFFDEFNQRTTDRLSSGSTGDAVATGIHELDRVLGGGLSLGELGVWIGYPKTGKSTILVNHGVQAVRRGNHNTLHIVLEGSRKLVENRYDTVFAQETYGTVKSGEFSEETYKKMQYDYQMYKKRLVIRGFTEKWNYTAADISEEMKELRRLYGWKPALMLVDYGDLLRGRGKYETETANQTEAFKDMKLLSNRGYAIWTATQAQRPDKDLSNNPEILYSRKISESYAKVRVADFIGSINQTLDEKAVNHMRLFAELYRDNAAGLVIPVKADFSRMTITVVRNPAERVLPTPVGTAVPLGYTAPPEQKKAPL